MLIPVSTSFITVSSMVQANEPASAEGFPANSIPISDSEISLPLMVPLKFPPMKIPYSAPEITLSEMVEGTKSSRLTVGFAMEIASRLELLIVFPVIVTLFTDLNMLMPSLPPVMLLLEITAFVTAGPAIALTLELPIIILNPVIVSPSVLPMPNTLF